MYVKNGGKLLTLLSISLIFCSVYAIGQSRSILPDTTLDSGLGGGNTVEGRVTLPSGQRLDRPIKVKLVTMTRGDIVTSTDGAGSFAFRGLVGGDYTVVIDEPEFKPVSYRLSIVQFRGSPPQSYLVPIRLELRPGSDYKPGVLNSDLAGAPPKAVDLYIKAADLAKAGDHAGSIEQLKLAIAEYPNFMLAFYEMGMQYYQIKQYDKAEQAFASAIKIRPDAFRPLLYRGIVLIVLNRYKDAEEALNGAIRVNEQSPEAHFYLGRAIGSESQDRFGDAEKEFQESIKLGGEQMKEAHRMLAIIYSSRGEKKNAAAELETYLKLAPDAPDASQLRKVIDRLKSSGSSMPPDPQ